jgi:hypothetical protein
MKCTDSENNCGIDVVWRDDQLLSFYTNVSVGYTECTNEIWTKIWRLCCSKLQIGCLKKIGSSWIGCRLSVLVVWVESYVKTDDQPASVSWNKTPIWGLRPDFYSCQTVAGLLMWGAFSDERTGSVVYNCCLSSPVQSFSGLSPVRLATTFYSLGLETSFFVVSYDLQGYGGGIPTASTRHFGGRRIRPP